MKHTKKKFFIALALLTLIFTILADSNAEAATRLNKTKATINVGETVTLKVMGTTKAFKWSTSNKKVATVSTKGKVKGLKLGKATITATYGKRSYSCRVTVTAKPSTRTKNYNAGSYSILKKHTGEATFYDRISTGACNLDYMEKKYYTCAMNIEDYNNGLAGAYIYIKDKDGDVVKAVVTDCLPEGKKGDIDLTRKAFAKIEPLVTGRMNIEWKIIPLPTPDPISYLFKPDSSKWWAQVQVRNQRYPIKKLEYYDVNAKKYVTLKRESFNYFTAPSGFGTSSIKFRVTDFYGHVLVDDGIKMNLTGTPVKGKKNFPY